MIQANGQVYLVGGALRDAYYQLDINDIDLEVYNLSFDELKMLFKDDIEYINDKFCTLKLNNIEIALPRLEQKVGYHYQDYQLTFNDISPKQAVLRRDFTINALMYDFNHKIIEDHVNGFHDLENKTLRFISKEHFSEDSIRCLRLLKYQSKLDLKIEDETYQQAKEMSSYLIYQPQDLVYNLFKNIINYEHLNIEYFLEILTNFFEFNTYKEIRIINVINGISLYNQLKGSLLTLKCFQKDIEKNYYYLLFITLLFIKTSKTFNSERFLKYQPFLLKKNKDIALVTNLIKDYHHLKEVIYDQDEIIYLKNKYQTNFYLLKIIDYCLYYSHFLNLNNQDFQERMNWYEENILIKFME